MTIKFGLTGSLASGKTTAGKIISKNKGPIFSADLVVKKLYRKYGFKKMISDRFNIKSKINFKAELLKKILQKKTNLLRLEKIIHPLVRKEMFKFIKKNKNHKFLFLEIPLLIENKLTNYFDRIIFVKSNKKIRMKRYLAKGGTSKLFKLLDTKQLKETKKIKYCDYVIVNNNSLTALKKKLYNIIKNYE